MSEPVLRLKRAVRARSLAAEGVAVSMGATAVVLRGAPADAVWRALEPVLRSGFTRAALVERFPAGGRAVLTGILGQLEEHGFLREAEEEYELGATERAAYPHLEALTARPFAALRALAGSSVRVRGESVAVEAAVRRALGRAGFRDVSADTGPPEPGVLATVRTTVPGHPEALHVIVAEGGVWAAGPRDATASPAALDALRAWAGALDEPAGADPGAPESEAARTLVAAQLALAAVAHVARVTEEAAPAPEAHAAGAAEGAVPTRVAHATRAAEGTAQTAVTDTARAAEGNGAAADARPAGGTRVRSPEFMVTTDELVSEPHRLPLLPELDAGRPGEFPEAPEPAELLTDRLDALAPLWDRVFGPVGEPLPGDLPQLPVGLARAGRRGVSGCGATTAQARLDALVGSLHAVAWGPAAGPGGRGLGSTRAEAVGDAVGDLVLRAGVPWKEVDPPGPMSAASRRLWAALTLRAGVAATVRFHELEDAGLWRAEVAGAAVLASGAAADPDAALREALTRAVAAVQGEDLPGLAVHAARTPDAAASLAAWSAATGRVRVAAPAGAAAWAAHGVHTAVAAWT
ncbi:hypothetical protein SUDANB121_03476 [Nocardiopsis dassonvillei]|uniref:hypothetical protein n=1 Tax=Nocardiopsis dassonvillei TaxID=2014 RepID=UPI003F552132